jgi:guanylate kinase
MSAEETPRGVLFVLSAPSGTGKSSLCRRLIEEVPGLQFSVSFTTRRRRAGEENGKQYWFVDDGRFDAMVAEDAFLEWAQVFGHRYGTGRAATAHALAGGRDLLLDIDVQGARQVSEAGEDAISVFLLPPDFTTLEGRLRSRRSEDEGEVGRRLALAGAEAEEFAHYDYLVVNDDLERATADLAAIVRAERLRTARRSADAARILATFPHRVSG